MFSNLLAAEKRVRGKTKVDAITTTDTSDVRGCCNSSSQARLAVTRVCCHGEALLLDLLDLLFKTAQSQIEKGHRSN